MEETEPTLRDPAPETPWELWYQDTFDRGSGLQIELRGRGLVRGLMELWARHLFETVRPDGGKGFARFHLSWQQRSIDIEGDWQGATRLRAWIYGSKAYSRQGYVEEAEGSLLEQIARVHAHLLVDHRSCAPILDGAAAAEDRQRFEERLLTPGSESRHKIICITIEDGLAFPSGKTAQASSVSIQYLKIPVRWLAGDDLLESKKEAVLENFYGQGWRRGNEDGSAYVVHRFKTNVLSAEETHERAWLQEDDPAAKYWYYHVTEDGHFKSVERETL